MTKFTKRHMLVIMLSALCILSGGMTVQANHSTEIHQLVSQITNSINENDTDYECCGSTTATAGISTKIGNAMEKHSVFAGVTAINIANLDNIEYADIEEKKTDIVASSGSSSGDVEKVITNESTTEIDTDVREKDSTEVAVVGAGTYYTTTNVNIRKGASTKDKVVDTLNFGVEVKVLNQFASWSLIKYKDETAYISNDYITTEKPEYRDYSAPGNSSFKAYMSYRAITSTRSPQYRVCHLEAYTGNYGIRQVDGRYCIAIGTYYGTEIGRRVDVILSNGTVIPCITGDVKADRDTDSANRQTSHDGSVVEFIIDSNALVSRVKRSGNISSCDPSWEGDVETIRIYE